MNTETKQNLEEIGYAAFLALEALVTPYTDALEADDHDAMESAEQMIHEDALSIEVRSGWQTNPDNLKPEEYNILLTTGGPAVRIIGDLDGNGYPTSARLEVQDWFTPWTVYHCSEETLMTYANCFYFGA